MSVKFKPQKEWFKQADYDIETAEVMFNGGRYIYAVFMCHLSVEKALKGLYAEKFKKDPPKVHDLIYLLEKIKIKLNKSHQDFLKNLNDLSIPTRYPDEIESLLKQYTKNRTEQILKQTREVIIWLKKNLKK